MPESFLYLSFLPCSLCPHSRRRYFTKPETLEILEKSVPKPLPPPAENDPAEEEEEEKRGILCRFESVPLPEPVATSPEQNKLYVTWRKTNGEEMKVCFAFE